MRNSALILIFGLLSFSHYGTVQAQWIQTSGGGADGTILVVSGTNLFAGWFGTVVRSSDNGVTWTGGTGLPDTYLHGLVVNSSGLFAGMYANDIKGGVYHSTDSGNTWTNLPIGYPYVNALVAKDSTLFAATDIDGGLDGGVNYADELLRSTDNGTSWQLYWRPAVLPYIDALVVNDSDVFAGLGANLDGSVSLGVCRFPLTVGSTEDTALTSFGIDCFALNGSNIFAGTASNGIYLSTNNGTTWKPVNTGLQNTNKSSIGTFAVVGTNIFVSVGDSNFIYLSTNNGTTWKAVNLGLPSEFTYANAITSLVTNGYYLFAATNGAGFWRRPIPEMITSVSPSLNNLPTQFALEQNFPNPFNPTTTISYSLPHESYVRLSIFNTLGQTVRTLVNQFEEAGNKSVSFDSGSLSSGVYFYRLQAGTFSDVKKLLVIK